MTRALGILGSTRGSSMLPILAAIESHQLDAEVKIVLSNKQDALILQRAREHHLPAQWVDPTPYTREAYDKQLSNILHQHHVELIVLVGYMRILSEPFVTTWQNRILNVHPSLLPAFAGQMDLALHQAVLDAGVKETGCTVHIVTPIVDAGPIVIQKRCAVLPGDTAHTLKARVQSLEGEALVEAIQSLY